MRLFVAVDLPEPLKAALAGLQREIKQQNLIEGHFVNPAGIHLTLKFLGDIHEESIVDLKRALAVVALKSKKFRLELSGLGAFPTKKALRVLFVSTKNSKQAAELHEAVDAALEPLGFAPDSRYETHITLARVRAIIKKEKLAGLFEKYANKTFGEFEVSEIVLFKITLTTAGPSYEVAAKFKLGK